MKNTALSVIIILFYFSIFLSYPFTTFAEGTPNPPAFPTCESKIFTNPGDWAHYDSGWHTILGIGSREGRDDVYQLTQGNFLQCFCPVEGTEGIQTNWWNIQRQGLNEEEIHSFFNQGWQKEDGGDWNLYNETYLAKNVTFSCVQATPTLTLTPTPTPSVTTPSGPISKCFDLEAQPTDGTAPLTVKFTGHADDPVTGGKIKEYRFDFGDASGGQSQVWFQTDRTAYHRYELSGTYTANLRIQDNAGNWRESDDCKATIIVHAQPPVLAASSPKELPSTGANILILIGLVPIGYYIYQRFKIV
ncbi:MAG: hypothetical protein UT61_C0014G0006 [Candidatus Woesebacteria bacterium GW2011_GWA1_39_8]|nr:MAG: hypothetical protein UT61_C0014G0006 [Candidatus Woesebacteria bacterium GW2011_GWA1_39_8]